MAILDFLLGLSIGLLLLIWQRMRSDVRLKRVLRKLQSDSQSLPFPAISQLSLAITQQQKVQHQLEQQLSILQTILDTAPIGYLQVDDETRLLWCNVKACRILGITGLEKGARPRLLLEWIRSYELDDLIQQTRHTGQICQRNWTLSPTSADPVNLSRQTPLTLQGYGMLLPDGQVGVF